jgi:class 3 adenylate cyclase
MAENKDLILKNEDLIKTNQRLNEQIKSLIAKNDQLTITVEELENQLNKDLVNDNENSFTVKGITVLFIEIQGFKRIINTDASSLKLYDKLDEIYIKFDEIAQKHKAQSVKVIGDYYVCAGGITEKNSTNPIDIALVALEINEYLNTIYKSYKKDGKVFWNLKIGIHSGNGIVNVMGRKNKTYTLTGEVINSLPRIAAMSELGDISISDYTYELIKSYFHCDYIAELPVKYRGSLSWYKLKRIKKKYSENRKLGIIPNNDFRLRYLMRQFTDI